MQWFLVCAAADVPRMIMPELPQRMVMRLRLQCARSVYQGTQAMSSAGGLQARAKRNPEQRAHLHTVGQPEAL